MHTIEASREFDADANALWDLLQDFAHIERWWPQGAIEIERVEFEGEGVGMIRHIYNVGMPSAVSERLDSLDVARKTWQLSIVGERPAGITRYQATGKIIELPGKRCRIDYRGEFTTDSDESDAARAFLQMAYDLMFSGLAAATA